MSIDAHVDVQPPVVTGKTGSHSGSGSDPTALYLWDEPVRVPHDKVFWSVRGEVRGNFPGFPDLPNVIGNATIRLSANFLVIARAPYYAAIPTAAIQRISLEGGGTAQQGAVLSVDYADSLGQLRRLWLGVRPRLGAAFLAKRYAIGTRWQAAGIGEVRLTPLIPGIHRMGNRAEPQHATTGPPRWQSTGRASLGSGEELALLAGYADHFTVTCGDRVLRLPYVDVIGLATRPTSDGSGETPVFISFMDDDVAVSLRIVLPEPLEEDGAGSNVLASLRDHGVRATEIGNPEAFRVPASSVEPASGSLVELVSEAPVRTGSGESRIAQPDARQAAPVSAADSTALERQTWTLATSWADGEARRERYAALVRHIVDERDVFVSLHAEHLLSDQDLEDHRRRMLAEIYTLHRLVQLNLLHEAGLIDEREFVQTRNDLLQNLAIKGSLTDGIA